jgi:hypothetical protein
LTETYRNLPNPKTNDKAHNVRFFFSRLRFWMVSTKIFKYFHSYHCIKILIIF